MFHVLGGIRLIQGFQVITSGDPLRNLAHIRPRQHFPQLGLADEDDLQKLLLGRFKIGEQTNLLEDFGTQILGLVHDQHRAPPATVGIQQVGVQTVDQRLDGATLRRLDPQFLGNRREEFPGRQLGIEDQRDVRLVRQLLEQAADQRGLAGTDFAGELNESAALGNAVEQVGQRVGMALAHVQVARVRSDGKGFFRQSEKLGVHAGKS